MNHYLILAIGTFIGVFAGLLIGGLCNAAHCGDCRHDLRQQYGLLKKAFLVIDDMRMADRYNSRVDFDVEEFLAELGKEVGSPPDPDCGDEDLGYYRGYQDGFEAGQGKSWSTLVGVAPYDSYGCCGVKPMTQADIDTGQVPPGRALMHLEKEG